jgi:hypothetical protein
MLKRCPTPCEKQAEEKKVESNSKRSGGKKS